MKTKKQIFYLQKVKDDPHTDSETCQNIILWTIKLYDHAIVMPDLSDLIDRCYYEN